MTTEEQITFARAVFDFHFTDDDKSNEFQFDIGLSSQDVGNPFFLKLAKHQFFSLLMTLYYQSCSYNGQNDRRWIDFLERQLSSAANKQELLNMVSEYIRIESVGYANDEFFNHVNYWYFHNKIALRREEDRRLGKPIQSDLSFEALRGTRFGRSSLSSIAMLCVYNKVHVSRENHDDIAEWYGHSSGHKLMLLYNKFANRPYRITTEDTKKKTETKIELLESVISDVKPEYRQRVIDELETLRKAFNAAFP
ncbi:MAG TPA: hypothetical protein VFE54_08915 [Mucilaginibacter sp.]|jgi:hypothetical protein|nr:hypothetical protein [Mucilaginibacter sp.]